MDHLYAPWREMYSIAVSDTQQTTASENDCVFCSQFKDQRDEQNFILARFKYMAIMMNLYPYNAGHLLILPFDHTANLHDLSTASRYELIELTTHAVEIVKKVLKADGMNVGFNLGRMAGAGIPSHLHMHILPRFIGDTNFLPTLCNTKAISFDLIKIYNMLKPEFAHLKLFNE